MSNSKKLSGKRASRRIDTHKARRAEGRALSGGIVNPPYGKPNLTKRAEPALDASIPQKNKRKPKKDYWCSAQSGKRHEDYVERKIEIHKFFDGEWIATYDLHTCIHCWRMRKRNFKWNRSKRR